MARRDALLTFYLNSCPICGHIRELGLFGEVLRPSNMYGPVNVSVDASWGFVCV